MHLFSTSRPRLANGLPQLCNATGAVPGIYLEPETSTTVRLTLWLAARGHENSYTPKHLTLSIADLSAFLSDYIADPEAVLLRVFAWTGAKPSAPSLAARAAMVKSVAPTTLADFSHLL